MKRLAYATAASVLVSLLGALLSTFAAIAQDAGQIASVRAGASCPGCNLFQAELSYLDLPGLDLSAARLRQANLSLATMNRTNFAGADLSVANAFGARFSGADFAGADLSRSVFVGAYVGHADFSNADLTDANFAGADFTGARNLTQSQLDQACGDGATILPAGFTLPPCG